MALINIITINFFEGEPVRLEFDSNDYFINLILTTGDTNSIVIKHKLSQFSNKDNLKLIDIFNNNRLGSNIISSIKLEYCDTMNGKIIEIMQFDRIDDKFNLTARYSGSISRIAKGNDYYKEEELNGITKCFEERIELRSSSVNFLIKDGD